MTTTSSDLGEPSGSPAPPSTRAAPLRTRILDELAYARDDHANPRTALSRASLYTGVQQTIYGYAPIAEAKRLGLTGTPQTLMPQGKQPYFDRVVADMLAEGQLVEPEPGMLSLANVIYDYEPGAGLRQVRRMNLAQAAGKFLTNDGLRKLFPPMGERQFAELCESMRVEGYDRSKPIVQDEDTGLILDGWERKRAATEAGVEPEIMLVKCSDDLERLRYAIRGNMLRRHSREESRRLLDQLTALHLTTREISEMLGRLVEGEGTARSVLAEPVPAASMPRQSRGKGQERNRFAEMRLVLKYVRDSIPEHYQFLNSELFAPIKPLLGRDIIDDSLQDYISQATRLAYQQGYLASDDPAEKRLKHYYITQAGLDYLEQTEGDEPDIPDNDIVGSEYVSAGTFQSFDPDDALWKQPRASRQVVADSTRYNNGTRKQDVENMALALRLETDKDGFSVYPDDEAIAWKVSEHFKIDPRLSHSTVYSYMQRAAKRQGVSIPRRKQRRGIERGLQHGLQ